MALRRDFLAAAYQRVSVRNAHRDRQAGTGGRGSGARAAPSRVHDGAATAARSRRAPSMRPRALATASAVEPAARFGRARAGDAAAVARHEHARHAAAAPRVHHRLEARLRLVPAQRASGRAREIHVGHHALMQQHLVDRQDLRYAAGRVAHAPAPGVAVDPQIRHVLDDARAPPHFAHEGAPLREVRGPAGTPAPVATPTAGGPAASCRESRRRPRPRAAVAPPRARATGRNRPAPCGPAAPNRRS